MLLHKKLWIIEDREEMWPVYDTALHEDSYNLTFFRNFKQFESSYLKEEEKAQPDLIVADIALEDLDFFKELHNSELQLATPFMVVSQSQDLDTMRTAFQAGAIDYIVKPVLGPELLAKTEKHLIDLQERSQEASKSLETLKLDKSLYTN